MKDPKHIAEHFLGHVDWQSPTTGLCLCPGESKHRHPTGLRDCRVMLDGIAGIHCFHTSCAAEVAALNKEFRRELWNNRWSLRLPGGTTIEGLASNRGPINTGTPACSSSQVQERVAFWTNKLPEILENHHWPFSQIMDDSPSRIWEAAPESQFAYWLSLWHPDDVIWVGNVYDSGRKEHASSFRRAADWEDIGPIAEFTCGAAFKPGSFARSKETMLAQRFLIVESDELHCDEVGAVFRFMRDVLHYPLHAIVDTAGKSLHGWFKPPRTEEKRQALKLCLTGLKCDPKMFSVTQPVRVPGALRDGRHVQELIYFQR